jgi:uncharacterized protein (TIGR03437 family)
MGICAYPSGRFAAAAMIVVGGIVATASLRAQGNDPDAGSWRMVVLSGPTQIAVAAPATVDDPAYQSELTSIKNAQANLTDDQKKAIAYWGAGGMMRWNEIAIALVAEFDLPPEPNPDGTYPAPNAADPFKIPMFPFANPPYASRTYSNLSVAQFEALKVAWYYKFLYNRPSPAKVDASIRALIPTNDLPAYPSEDAVEAGVAAALLKIFFPTKAAYIDQLAAEQQQAAMLAGKATASDIAAGWTVGQSVAAIIAKRASTDGMKAAAGTPAIWQAMADAAVARGEIPWKSQESPPRPPMLPLFGKVAAWMMTPADIVTERPAAPPSTSSQQMAKELAEVKNTVDNITREQLAISYKWNDGASSPTPPGHWNLIAQPYITHANFSEVRIARTYALLNMAMHDAAVACWDAKFTYYNPRAVQLDPTIKTVIPLPNFPSYTSGHSTFSAAASDILSYVFPSGASYFAAQRDEAAMSRLYAAIHYRSDIEVGKTHGSRVAEYTLRFARLDGADPTATPTSGLTPALVDGASYRPAVTPGSIATVFAAKLGSAPALASGSWLPTTLGGVSMHFNGFVPAPFFFVSVDQANIQIPWELQGHDSVSLTVINADGGSASVALPLAAFAPAVFRVNQGSSQGAVTLANSSVLAAPAGTITGAETRAAARGDFLTIYCLGLGEVNNRPSTGQPTPDSSSTTKAPVTVLLNDIAVPASYAGLAPGYVGLYQVNVQIPADAPTGGAVTLAVSVGGITSNTVTIAVQ